MITISEERAAPSAVIASETAIMSCLVVTVQTSIPTPFA